MNKVKSMPNSIDARKHTTPTIMSPMPPSCIMNPIPRNDIKKETQKELVDLDEQCNAKVIFNCKPDNITLSIEGGHKFECTYEPVKLAPGRYKVAATRITDTGYTISDNATIKLSANQTERIDVFLEDGDCYPANPPFSNDHFTFWGWVMAGTGLALTTVGTGLFFADPISGDIFNNTLTSTALITLGGANFIAGLQYSLPIRLILL